MGPGHSVRLCLEEFEFKIILGGLTLYENPKCARVEGCWKDSTNAHGRFSLGRAQVTADSMAH